jgi:hypothetical protein
VSSKLLEERQAEMRQRRLQERANRKKHQFALERKDVSGAWHTAPDESQVESEPLEKTRRVGDRKTSERQYDRQPR